MIASDTNFWESKCSFYTILKGNYWVKISFIGIKENMCFYFFNLCFWGVDDESGIDLWRSALEISFFLFLIENDNGGLMGIGGFWGWEKA